MSREWKPGDAAMIRLGARCDGRGERGEGWATAIRDNVGSWACGVATARIANDEDILEARPLVVIDPEDREQVERLADLNERATPEGWVSPTDATNAMQAALREFADPTPPKPDEPTGLGAVIEDANGDLWVRLRPAEWQWRRADDEGLFQGWHNISAVRVLSPGVASDD